MHQPFTQSRNTRFFYQLHRTLSRFDNLSSLLANRRCGGGVSQLVELNLQTNLGAHFLQPPSLPIIPQNLYNFCSLFLSTLGSDVGARNKPLTFSHTPDLAHNSTLRLSAQLYCLPRTCFRDLFPPSF